MSDVLTIGSRFRALWERSGLSQRELAEGAGFNHASGIQRYVDTTHDTPIKPEVAIRFAKALAGKGSPAILADEVMALTGLPQSNAQPVKFEGAPSVVLRDDLPIFGTALGAPKIVDGEAVEQTTLNRGEVVEYIKRPTILNGTPDAYGLYVQGSSMYPVHPEGTLLLAQAKKPPRVGDDVVVYLRCNGDDDDGERARGVLVKRLVRRSAQYVELQQFTPDMTFRLDAADVLRIDRVLTLGDLLS
ncbi:Phage repressor protein C, contains Cro/C1-type HTH and peptisase s24 domains [Sphingomonas laterariae]|uniref:Phage repressor protein C, contains Cro/C1-type HTH and peptisase s24 domains n=1 Tax=Edaphosphingomonas laterariae TaxID=861865 RepID=A0A239KE61_9SPHN|nr:S24 family peptidase [Sphingomonas laterariae]SNT15953.1 Phage repressor protein C, contains Cro/C1-type HTH and peptisase s24 domains [Sphingomonas laterariae]